MTSKIPEKTKEIESKKPWPIRYVVLAVLVFAIIFNMWVLWGN